MTPYANLSGDSGVLEYEAGPRFIKVRSDNSSAIYVYNYSTPGRNHVELMKELAAKGRGLAMYIAQHVKKCYSRIE